MAWGGDGGRVSCLLRTLEEECGRCTTAARCDAFGSMHLGLGFGEGGGVVRPGNGICMDITLLVKYLPLVPAPALH